MKKYHLVATIDVLRHGEKNENGQLTNKGFYQSAMKAIKIDHLDGDVHVYHSGNNRVMKTVSTIHNLLKKDAHYVQDQNFQGDIDGHVDGEEDLFDIDDHVEPKLHFLYDSSTKGTYFPKWSKTLNYDDSCQRMQDFLNLDTASPDKDVAPSPKEMAQRLFSVVVGQIHSVLDTEYHTRENFINGTHEPVLMSGIFYMQNYLKFGKSDFVKHMGGSVDFTEGFHIKIFQRRNGEHLLQYVFRDFMIDFSIEDLEKFISE